MPNEVIFKTFRTKKHPYVYERGKGTIIVLPEDDHQELAQVENGDLDAEQSPVIQKYRNEGLFMENTIWEIEHNGSVTINQYVNTRMQQLTLQVTQQCNLRCAYCAYSGDYSNARTHSNSKMSYETAMSAIDFFLARNTELSEVVIGFYGGEPLLEFGLIKRCVEYAKSRVEGKKVKFNLTTNGTLISDEAADFLAENDFMLNISIDGSEEEHDRSRKYPDGTGSFATIISNIKKLRSKYPEYDRKIAISTTINPFIDLSCVLEYFSTEDVFQDRNIMFNQMTEKDYIGDATYDQKYFRVRSYEYIKMLFSLIGKLDEKYVSRLYASVKAEFALKRESINNRAQLPSKTHHNGPCMPGVKRLFVRTDGTLFPCERVNETLEFFKIGTLEDGIDIDKVKGILNIGQITSNECKSCWALRQCSLCASQISFNETLTKEDKLLSCPGCIERSMFEIYELCVLNEFGYSAEGASYL